MFIDTHTHMDHLRFDSDRKNILQLTKEAGVGILVNPAISFETNDTMRQKLEKYDWIYYAAGIHPNYVGTDDSVDGECQEII